MTQDQTRKTSSAARRTVARIGGTAAVALFMLLGVAGASQPAAAAVVAPLQGAKAIALAAGPQSLQATPVGFKTFGGVRGRSFRGGHRFGGFGVKRHGFHGSRFAGTKKFGHSGIGIKKFGAPIHGLRGKSFKSKGFVSHGFGSHKSFKRY